MSDKDFLTVSLEKGKTFSYKFDNPAGALVKCTVTQGKGKVTLMADKEKVAGPYNLSLSPGKPFYVSLNTERSQQYDVAYQVVIEATGQKKDEENTFVLELPLGKTPQSYRKHIVKRRTRRQSN
jgi:hypothetical protein